MAVTAPAQKRSVLRSPNFPLIDLGEAIGRAKIIWDRERRAPASAEVILGHLGYKQRSGPAGRVLSALLQYGLLEKHKGGYRLSEDANRILNLSEGAAERKQALRESGKRPALFGELLATYADGLPSDEALRDHLISAKQFNPTSVSHFVRAFRATIELAGLAPGEYKEPSQETRDATGEMDGGMGAVPETQGDQKGATTLAFNWVLSVPRGVRAELRIHGSSIRKADVERLRKQLDFLEESFDEDTDDAS